MSVCTPRSSPTDTSPAHSLPSSSPVALFGSPPIEPPRLTAMATTTIVQNADLKKAFAADLVPNTSFASTRFDPTFAHPPRRPPWNRRPSMVQTNSRTFMPIPSFMAVFGEEVNSTGTKDLSERDGTSAHGSHIGRPASSGNTAPSSNVPFAAFHAHRDSTSTLASESSDSSPTTTISTMDSNSVTDPSPGPSPESPVSKAAPSSFVPDFRSRRTDSNSLDNSPTFFELARPTTPAKKPRNLKNLGINTTSSLGNLRANPSASLPALARKEKNTSAPTSPSFIKPPTPPKRRPSNLSLTIQTPGSNESKGPMRLVIPSTPALNRPALRHFQSSPSLPLCSPNVLLSGGMQLPALRPIKTNPHGFSEVPFEMEEEDQEQNFDIPQSREEKPAAYPNGPICIYESGVYLYFEPTAEQAATFDVIVNVASEVKNPFTSPASVSQKELDARRVDGPPAEHVDFASLPERSKPSSFDTEGSSPTTPKATPVLDAPQQTEHVSNGIESPEYIHMLWEHNTDIVPDLYKLVKTMDDRVQQGKRVLVHCQCGVSRSASLIVAYGLYKNPGISVQEAYDSVKKRSKWIGPNMNLIMQLQEFRNGLLKMNENRSYHNQVYGLNPRRSAGLPSGVSTGTNRRSPFDREAPSGPRTPQTAPLPPDDLNMQRASTGNMISISPGPMSAPSGAYFSPGFRRSWASSQTHFDLSPKSSPTATPYVDPKGHVLPVLSITDDDQSVRQADAKPPEESVPPGQADLQPPVPNFSRQLPFRSDVDNTPSEGFLAAPLQPSVSGALRSPAVPSFNIPALAPHHAGGSRLLSPRTTEFNLNPWPQGYDMDSPSSPKSFGAEEQQSQVSPRSPEFHIASLGSGEVDDAHGPRSPRAATFDVEPPQGVQQPGDWPPQFSAMSPTVTEFPKDILPHTADALEAELTSPRATEFHMTPLKPRVADKDPFGLTSPRRFEFPSIAFEEAALAPPRNVEPEDRRPSFQAILPPSHLAQPEAVNGFTSLNGTAQVQPTINVLEPILDHEASKTPDYRRIDSLSTSPEPQTAAPAPRTPGFASPESRWPTPRTPEHLFLSTPSRQTSIRTRFSSPNMREQRRLHRLQTEMEALLPHRVPHPPQAADDLDALLSPRAEEFTRNPFHVDFCPAVDASPASSNETIKDGQHPSDWKDMPRLTPKKSIEEDPRSPVQTGSSPIVRNIWDVL